MPHKTRQNTTSQERELTWFGEVVVFVVGGTLGLIWGAVSGLLCLAWVIYWEIPKGVFLRLIYRDVPGQRLDRFDD